MDKNRNQFKIGALLSYFAIALNLVSGLIYTPWMIDKIGQGDYGLYTLANSLISLFVIDFGLSTATSRYVSKYRAEGKQKDINNFLGIIYKLYILIDLLFLVVLCIVYFFIPRIYVKLSPEELEKFRIVYIMSASFAVVNFPFITLNGILNSYEKFIQLKSADIIYRVLLVGITIALLSIGYGLYALVLSHVLIGLILILYKLTAIHRTTPIKINWHYNQKSLFKELSRFSFWVTISTVSQRMIFSIVPSILGVVANTSAIAIFGVITTIEGYAFTISSAINGMFLPKIAKINISTKKTEKLNSLLLKVGKFQYIVNGLIVAVFVAIGKDFIYLWVGNEYRDAYIGIILVLIPGLLYNALQIAHTSLIVDNKVNLQAAVDLSVGILNVILSFVFSKRFGVIGAAISIFLSYMVRVIVLMIIYKKKLDINIWDFALKCYMRMSVPVGFCILSGMIVNSLFQTKTWLSLVIKGLILVVIYLSSVLIFGFSKQERKDVFRLLKGIAEVR